MSYGKLYPTEKTTIEVKPFMKALISEWNKMFNEIPSKESVCTVCAKYSLETNFGKNCYAYNLGNIKKFVNDSHPDGYVQLSGTFEYVNGQKIVYPKENPVSYFRHYFTLEDGIRDYLRLISSQRYAKTFATLKKGDPAAYSQALHDAGYYTAPVKTYTTLVVALFNKFYKTTNYEEALFDYNTERSPKEIVVETIPETIQETLPVNDVVAIVPKQSIFSIIMEFLTRIFKR